MKQSVYLGVQFYSKERHRLSFIYYQFDFRNTFIINCTQMAQGQLINQLNWKISNLMTQLSDKQKQLDQYHTIEAQADAKIKTLSKMHAQKIKSLLNSIQILKKQKASLQGLSKQHKRSKLIEQLNKEISDQDLAIDVLRKYIYEQKGKQEGRIICDKIIVDALTKGPDRIRPLSRQQLKMEIEKLKSISIQLQSKLKNGLKGGKNVGGKYAKDIDEISEISQPSQQSFVNQNQTVLNKLKDLQFQNQNMRLEVNAKVKIIEKLKNEVKQKDKIKAQTQILKNQIEVARRKVLTYEKLMKQSKDSTNTKIIELYQRQIKVEELEMVSRQNQDELNRAKQSHGIMLEQMKLQRQKLQAQIQALKKQNQQLILESITNKKRQDQQKNKINEIRDLNVKQNKQLQEKLKFYTEEIQNLTDKNKELFDSYRKIQDQLFSERAKWVEDKQALLQEIQKLKLSQGQSQTVNKYMQDVDRLRKQNQDLKLAILMDKKQGDEPLVKLQDKQQQTKKNKDRKVIEVNKKEKNLYDNMTSGISSLNLEDVDSSILDNFDSSFQYEIVVMEDGTKVKMPKITRADQQLLKLMSSDLWYFVQNQKVQMGNKIDQAASLYLSEDSGFEEDQNLKYKARKLKNLNHPQGKKIIMYDQQINKLDQVSDSVSVTSAKKNELQKFNSDVDIQIRNLKYQPPKELNLRNLYNMNLSSGSSVDENYREAMKKKKKVEKGSVIDIKKQSKQLGDSDISVTSQSEMLNSDVSSVNVNEKQLQLIDSDIEHNFKKKNK